MEKGLINVAPSQEKPCITVLKYHIRAVRRKLDLKKSQLDRVLCSLWCTQFQGVLRLGDLIRSTMENPRYWDPVLDIYRGIVTFQMVRGESHAKGLMRTNIYLKPVKNGQAGEKIFVKSFVALKNPFELSAGDAVNSIL